MADYWKSTPNYWCKHCKVYVRDTQLERTNHEATAKHQSAVKRSLRELHRDAELKEREKERAKREVERLNGVVSGPSSSATGGASRSGPGARPSGGAYGAPLQQVSPAERQKQLEQLAELGVNIPTELRGGLAMAGEWTVTSTRVIEQQTNGDAENKGSSTPDSRATGVKRERDRTEEEKEQEEAIKGLFKKPRRWGVDSKAMPAEEDAELDALLSEPLAKIKKEESETPPTKTEADQGEVAESVKPDASPPVKKEPEDGGIGSGDEPSSEPVPGPPSEAPAVMFKKRKAKNIRQK
ncbi:9884642f-a123-40c1-81bb-8f0241e7b64c [Thermothielavioides terrestris]|jgi:hypothetical protein|uniref:U1-type domain-containing protein n=2 Tax=Thermothielavioides terrestris TaxID=2587410 RepID=G2QWC2_THETT|nr:uncharacterized protein THITE_2109519 [Thermothielavioides terrestris NRRL 8126]AEO63897.1 hypothetical protein THITE_2109519 [Thermothielavioides terrestris NRRL 8126]SPQ23375.1 9884642f-a123-40c1-81bb-8f0241e7b64c [Thermothielavioides terrestris]